MAELGELRMRDALRAWYGALGSGVLWAIHLIVVYGWDEAACSTGAGVEATEAVFLTATAIAAGGSLAAGAAAFLTRRATRSGDISDPRGRIAFLGVVGMLAAVIFTFAIVLEGIHVVVFPTCEPG